MSRRLSLCLYCGSNAGTNPAYVEAAAELGRFLAQGQMRLVYGGGRVGLMGAAADACMQAGGEVLGIIPDFLLRHEVGHTELTELQVVSTMHERKMRMAESADAFCILPGGLGTLEELFEVLTWRQLGLHQKPIILLNVAEYWQPLLSLIEHQAEAGFLRSEHLSYLRCISQVPELEEVLEAYLPRQGPQAFD
jgi:uncharacterized protein (TIGR00730 family)